MEHRPWRGSKSRPVHGNKDVLGPFPAEISLMNQPLHLLSDRTLRVTFHPRPVLVRLMAQLESEVPILRHDMDTFFEEFEHRSHNIAVHAAPNDEAFVWRELEAIIQRSGVNER